MKERLVSFLRWSERYTKTDMIHLAGGGFWLMSSYVIQVAFGLILSIAFANLLPKDAYGTYQFVIAGAAIMGAFTLSGMGTAIVSAVARGSHGALRSGFWTQLKWSAGIVLTGGAVATYYYVMGNYTLAIAFLVVAVSTPLISSFNLYATFLIGRELFRENSITETLQRTLPFVVVLSSLLLTHDPLFIIFAYFGSNVVTSLLLYLFVVRTYPAPYAHDPELTSYSKHLSLMSLLTTLSSSADKILIFHFVGAAPLAAYALAQAPVLQLQSLFGLARMYALPKLAQRNLLALQQSLPNKIRLFFVISIATAAAYMLAAPFLFSTFFPLYPEAVLYSQILALLLLAAPRMLVEQTFYAHEMTQELYILNVSVPFVRLILVGILAASYGIWGVIAALLFAELYSTVLQGYLFRRLI